MGVVAPALARSTTPTAWLAGALRRLTAVLAGLAKALVVVLATLMVAAIVWQVFTRAVLGRSPPWTEEVALLLFAWIVLLMLAIGVREQLHVRVDALLRTLPPRLASAGERAVSLLIAAIGAYLVWAGLQYLLAMRGSTSQAIRYPSELLYASMPLAATLLCLFALEHAFWGPKAGGDGAAP